MVIVKAVLYQDKVANLLEGSYPMKFFEKSMGQVLVPWSISELCCHWSGWMRWDQTLTEADTCTYVWLHMLMFDFTSLVPLQFSQWHGCKRGKTETISFPIFLWVQTIPLLPGDNISQIFKSSRKDRQPGMTVALTLNLINK